MRKAILITVLALVIVPGLSADDEVFKVFKLSYNVAAFADFSTTLHASRSLKYIEMNPITKLYWREPSAFCVFKFAETIALNELLISCIGRIRPWG